MAISGGDGSIILTTKVDQSGLSKGMTSMQKGVKSLSSSFAALGSTIAAIFSATAIIRFSKQSGEFATQTEASVQRLIDIYGEAAESVGGFIDANARAIGMSKSAGASIAATYGNLLSVWADQETNAQLTNNLLNQTAVVASKTGRTTTDVAERIRSGLLGNTEAIEDLGINVNIKTIEITDAFKRIADGRSWEQLNAYEQSQVRTLAILEQSTKKYGTTVAETSATARNQYQAAYEDFQNAWGQVVNTVLIPVLEVLTQVFTVATKGLQVMVGLSGKTVENSGQTSSNIKKQTKQQEKLNKAVKKGLASFDEINALTEQSAENTADAGTGTQVSGIGDLGGGLDGSSYVKEISSTLMAIMGVVALAMVAVGLILLFTGHIGWGVGFIIAGAGILAVTMASASEFGYDGIINMLTTIMGIAGGALLALGIILLWIGGVVGKGVAIGMIIAGGALIVSAVAAKAAFSPKDVGGWLTLIMGIAAGALLALGIILCMVGSTPLGVGMIIAGSVALVSAVALNFDVVKDQITGWVAVIMGIAGAALLVLGIILCATGVGVATGIALIAAGAVALVTPIALNSDAIVDWVKGAWDAVKEFWNKNIAPVFTAKWWGDLGKVCINGLIAGFEGGINGITKAFESMINWIVDGVNKLSFDVPDWVPGIGGKKFGFNLPRADFKEVKIPRLAQGAVIPPNREFLAVLGDQKHGTNIEAPLDTIKQALAEVLLQVQMPVQQDDRPIVLQIDGREIARAVRSGENKMGSQIVFGGFANAY